MTRRLKFEKESTGEWYVDLPEWEGPRADLQMVAGADAWLDIMCQGEWHVWVTVSDEPFDGADQLELVNSSLPEGATYWLRSYLGLDYFIEMWLCDVTKFVFGGFPSVIYFR